MKQMIVLILTCICWDAISSVPYYYDEYPYYSFLSVVDKSKFEISSYQFKNNKFENVFLKKIATGKNAGNKMQEGDGKTPEGIYFTKNYADEKELKKHYGIMGNIYGVGAWTLDYPNKVDQKLYSKTGTGIWIHGTNDPDRIEDKFSSKGCVVLKNEDFNEFYSKINRPHPVIITDSFVLLDHKEIEEVKNFILKWKTDWEMTDDNYFSHYHEKFLSKNKIQKFKQYKKSMFNHRKNLVVTFDNINIIKHKDYFLVSFLILVNKLHH
jgi:murein L,D-transpeptidase YafK